MRGARGRPLASDDAIEAYVDGLGFAVAGTFGGHTSCVELETGGRDYVLCDLGSGVRPFGQAVLARHGAGAPRTYHIFLSHLHWDHIMGLPFFIPAYIPGNRLRIYGGHAEAGAARRQMDAPSFPVGFSTFRAAFEFVHLVPGVRHDVADMTVTTLRQRHTGDSYGYRFERAGRVVRITDSEHKLEDPGETDRFVEFFRGADLVIFDAMYSLADAISVKADWGHSSNVVGVELCQLARAAHLCLFHHEPASDDRAIAKVLADAQRLEEITRTEAPLRVSAAYDGWKSRLSADPALDLPASRTGRIHLAGAALIAVFTCVIAISPRFATPLREAWFDAVQRIMPRAVRAMPATVVEIDAKSLAELGRWPWPRSLLADLLTRVSGTACGDRVGHPDARGRSRRRAARACASRDTGRPRRGGAARAHGDVTASSAVPDRRRAGRTGGAATRRAFHRCAHQRRAAQSRGVRLGPHLRRPYGGSCAVSLSSRR